MSVPRRVVTGHTPDGVSVVLSDGPVPVSRSLPDDGVSFHEIWNTEGAPAVVRAVEPDEPTSRTLAVPPPPSGTKIRINEFLPGHLDERGLQSPVHRTASVDYGIVLSGEITLGVADVDLIHLRLLALVCSADRALSSGAVPGVIPPRRRP